MISVFNRKELITTMDMKRQSDIREWLSNEGIDYSIKTTNIQSAAVFGCSRGRIGTLGIRQDYSYEYKIYVRKNDYKRAKLLVVYNMQN